MQNTDTKRPKDTSTISGLSLRPFRGERDYAGIAAVLTASSRADQVERQVTAEDIATAISHAANCDPYSDIVIAELAGETVGYARGWWEYDSPTGRLYKHNAFLRPEWRRKGIGTALLLWTEERLRHIAAGHPPQEARYFQVSVSQFQKGTAILLERAGYQPARYFYEMVRPTLDDIPDLPLPAGLELRPVLPEHYRALWECIDEAAQDEWGYHKPTEANYRNWLADPEFQPGLWQVAWDIAADRIVGHVLTFINYAENEQFNRRRGYTEGIGVRRAWRRRGLARAMICTSLAVLQAAGMSESALVADSASANDVTRLYASCGFQIAKCDTIYRKPLTTR